MHISILLITYAIYVKLQPDMPQELFSSIGTPPYPTVYFQFGE